MTTRLIFIGLAFLSLLTLSPAQETKPEKPKSSFRVLALNSVPAGMFYKLKEKDVAIETPQQLRSPFYEMPSAGSLTFYTSEKLADGSTNLKTLATVTIPPGISFGLVVLNQTSQGVSARMFDDGPEAFPVGSYLILNMLPSEASIVLAKESYLLPPLGDKIIRPNPAGAGRTLFIRIYQLIAGNRQLLFSNNWAFNESLRTLVVISPPSPPSESPLVWRLAEPMNIFDSPVPTANPTTP